jgi:MFS family permease
MIKLYLILTPAYLCSTTQGFDSNTFGGAAALPAFISFFNLDQGNTQGLLGSMFVVGNIAGCLVAAQIADRWGRKMSMASGSAICILGAVLQVAATNGNMLIAGRVILGFGATISRWVLRYDFHISFNSWVANTDRRSTASPAYVVEHSHPAYRGILTGLANAMFFSASSDLKTTVFPLSADRAIQAVRSCLRLSCTDSRMSQATPTGVGRSLCHCRLCRLSSCS